MRTLLPDGVADALNRTCDNLLRVMGALAARGTADLAGAANRAPALRVADADARRAQRLTEPKRTLTVGTIRSDGES